MKKEYDIIYSLGASCACAGYMKQHNLRSFSGPFDWLTNAPFEVNTDLILNDFKDFCNFEDFVPYDRNDGIIYDCDSYSNKKTNLLFFHDFKKEVPFSEIFPSVKEKYERRIARFYERIKNSSKVLLIWYNYFGKTDEADVTDKCNAIVQKFGKNIDFLIIEHDETKPKGEIEYNKLTDNITYALLYIQQKDANGNHTTFGDKKTSNKIFKQYRLKMSFSKRAYLFIKKFSIKLICAFIPSKSLRKKLKSKI